MLPARSNIQFEKQSKFIQERIASVEKNFSELCSGFALYARKVARLRDAGDEVSNALKLYSDYENVNRSLSLGLSDAAATFCAIEEYRNARAQRLEVKVVGELSQYENICKHFRGEIKHTLSARESELTRKKALDRIKERNPSNRQQIMHAETELRKASADMSRTAKDLQEQTDSFEKKKLQNIKGVLKTFIEIEMSFLTKALELYTVAYRQIDGIDCEADLTDYKERSESSEDAELRRRSVSGAASSPSRSKTAAAADEVSVESETTSEESEDATENSDDGADASFYR